MASRAQTRPPVWKSWFVLVSLWTDPVYVSRWLRGRLERFFRPQNLASGSVVPTPARAIRSGTAQVGDDLADLPVDLVYLWVSGQDPAHRDKRNHWLQKYGLNPSVANPDVRYVEDDELRYSLRSVEMFLPWVRRIFLVTDNQVPEWLDLSHSKIQIVNQETIIPNPEWSPTFNSVAIEAQLDRIPGLSDHFIYSNDDQFFGAPCRKGDFFARLPADQGDRVAMKVMFSGTDDDWITPAHFDFGDPLEQIWMYAFNNLKVLLELRRPWRKVRYVDFHQAQSMTKSALRATTEEFPREYQRISAGKFRSTRDINFLCLARYRCLANGTAVRGYMSSKVFARESDLRGYTRADLPTVFCINGGLGEDDLGTGRMLERLFPYRSAFELAHKTVGRDDR